MQRVLAMLLTALLCGGLFVVPAGAQDVTAASQQSILDRRDTPKRGCISHPPVVVPADYDVVVRVWKQSGYTPGTYGGDDKFTFSRNTRRVTLDSGRVKVREGRVILNDFLMGDIDHVWTCNRLKLKTPRGNFFFDEWRRIDPGQNNNVIRWQHRKKTVVGDTIQLRTNVQALVAVYKSEGNRLG